MDNVDKVAGGVKFDGKQAADFHAVTVQMYFKASIKLPATTAASASTATAAIKPTNQQCDDCARLSLTGTLNG
jgi:hypothetical protein